jgi:polyisoprenoid-binding protein YceI
MHAQKQSDSRTFWRFDRSHSSLEFSIKRFFLLTVKGRLTDLDGSIVLDEADVSRSSVLANIGAGSIDTGNERRDAHLKSADFLDASKYPQICFQSAKVGRGKDRDMLSIKGALTIRDKSQEIVLDVTEVDRSRSPNGEEVIYYVAMTELDRFDFGISPWRGVIGQKLKVVINVQANRV